MNIFYCPDAVLSEYCELDETESRHMVTVLRKREGKEIKVFDGKGNLFEARIETIGKKVATLNIITLLQVEDKAQPKLHIAIAPPKNIEGLEWFAEKATEIGVHEITPVICKHSERKELRADRIDKVLLGASKQSLKLTIPRFNPPVSFNDFVTQKRKSEQQFIAYCEEKPMHLKEAYRGKFDAVILIGPEGDFTKEEVLLASGNNFQIVSLGKSRLRLETAGIYATTVFNLANES